MNNCQNLSTPFSFGYCSVWTLSLTRYILSMQFKGLCLNSSGFQYNFPPNLGQVMAWYFLWGAFNMFSNVSLFSASGKAHLCMYGDHICLIACFLFVWALRNCRESPLSVCLSIVFWHSNKFLCFWGIICCYDYVL